MGSGDVYVDECRTEHRENGDRDAGNRADVLLLLAFAPGISLELTSI